METWSWGDFLSVWIPFCFALDIFFVVMDKFNSKTTSSQEDERKRKTKSLNTQFKDDVTYNMASKNLSMRTVELLQPKTNTEDRLPQASEVEGEEIDPIQKEQKSNEAKLVRLYNLRKKDNNNI
jgi:hypothetical protein